MDLEALAWHASANAPESDGSSYWCSADETIGPDGGYLDEWMQYLDTPALTLGDNATVSAKLRWRIEDPAECCCSRIMYMAGMLQTLEFQLMVVQHGNFI